MGKLFTYLNVLMSGGGRMTWGWGILLALGAVILLILLVPIQVELHYKREGKDDRLHLGIRALFGLVRLGYDIPVMALFNKGSAVIVKKDPAKQMPKEQRGWVTVTVEKIDKFARQVRKIRERIGKYKRALLRLSKCFHLMQFRWDTMFGTGDAARTATLAGLGWAIKGVLSGLLYSYVSVEKRLRYNIQPHFQAKGFRTELRCIIRFTLGKVIIAVLTLAFLWLMEGIKWRSIRFKA